MCKKDDEALRLLREVVTGEQGQSKANDDNITVSRERETGTSKDYTLDRLAREDAEHSPRARRDRESPGGRVPRPGTPHAHGLTLRTSQPKRERLSPRKPIKRCYHKTAW